MQVYGEKWNSVPAETETGFERLLLPASGHAAPCDHAASALKAVLALGWVVSSRQPRRGGVGWGGQRVWLRRG